MPQLLQRDFGRVKDVRGDTGDMLRPARRTSVSKFCQEEMVIDLPGGTEGLWSSDLTPYMPRPMNMLKSRVHEAVVFMGPARTGKTVGLIDGWTAHSVVCDPGDFLLVQMSQTLARTYSNTRMARLHESCKPLAEQLRRGSHDDNTYDKRYRSGMQLMFGWPSPSQFASRDFKYVALTDLDRMPEHIGRDGSPFAAARKRTQTFMSSGMTLAESSPGFDVEDDTDWRQGSAHEMPPAKGITGLYNLGTRELWYFQCWSCKGWYVPDFPQAFHWVDSEDIEEAAASTQFVCHHCGSFDAADTGRRRELNAGGQWCGDGQTLSETGELLGDPRVSNIASFRIPAGAAAFQAPSSIVRNWLQAKRDWELTGDEEKLRTTVGQDQGKPYRRMSLYRRRTAQELQERAETLGQNVVPRGVRFLKAAIDVQQYYFAVCVVGWGPNFERWVLDRFDIKRSSRVIDEDTFDVVQPAMYVEDWELLISQVVNRRYLLNDGTDRTMGIKLTCCDSGGFSDGEFSVTDRAYEFWREYIKGRYENRFILVKGEPRRGTPRIRKTYPDSSGRKDRKADARGEIPVYMINTEIVKDSLNRDLGREGSGRMVLHFNDSLPDSFYDELVAEKKDPKKGWQAGKARNESWDLLTYDRATAIPLGVEAKEFWEKAPKWAREWDENSLVTAPAGQTPEVIQRSERRQEGRRRRRRGVRVRSRGVGGI